MTVSHAFFCLIFFAGCSAVAFFAGCLIEYAFRHRRAHSLRRNRRLVNHIEIGFKARPRSPTGEP
jgi:hypothetical protein